MSTQQGRLISADTEDTSTTTSADNSAIGYQPPASRVPIKTFRIQPQATWLPLVDVKEFEQQLSLFEGTSEARFRVNNVPRFDN